MTGAQLPPTDVENTPEARNGSRSGVLEALVTVRDLLAVRALRMRLLAAPEAIDVGVRWAHPTELLDPRAYLTGGELVLTVGSSLAGDEARCRDFVERLVEADASAIGYGVGNITDDVPLALEMACRRRGLPLLEIPADVPFQAITELLADRRADALAAAERRVQHLLTRLLDAMAVGRSLEELLDVVSTELGGRVTYRDGQLHWEAVTGTEAAPSASTLRHITSVFVLRQHEQNVELAHRRAESGRLLRLVADGRADAGVLHEALAEAGVSADHRVVMAAWPPQVMDLLVERLGAALFVDVPQGSLSVTASAEDVIGTALDLAVPCGVAAPCAVEDLASALPAALAALDLSRSRGAPATHRDLVSFEGLLEQQPLERLHPFAETLVLPLVEHDRLHGTALVSTLRAFLGGDGSVISTAQDLHLHPNSLRHRVKRIGELTGSNPRVFADRVALAIALWAWDRRPRSRR